MESIINWLIPQEFMPHGHCYLWTPALLRLYVFSDLFVGLAYFSIPIALLYFVHKREDLVFNWIFFMFSAFILACGTTHLVAIWTIWEPVYWLDASLKAITAILSIVTAILLWRLIPDALKIPSSKQLKDGIDMLEQEVLRRCAAERTLQEVNIELDAKIIERTKELTEANHNLLASRQQIEDKVLELTRINDELKNFSYVASHDLKSPLRGIDQLATWIAEDLGDTLNESTSEHLRLMRNRIKRMERLLDDLLAYSKVGKSEHVTSMVNTRELTCEIFDLCVMNHQIRLELKGELPVITTYRTPFEVVLRNLIGNAIKHRPTLTGFVEVEVNLVGSSIHCFVRDDGPGIPPEHHERVFVMFQTLQPRDVVEGSGIGLALVKKTVEVFGGTIQLESDGKNGSILHFTWPAL